MTTRSLWNHCKTTSLQLITINFLFLHPFTVSECFFSCHWFLFAQSRPRVTRGAQMVCYHALIYASMDVVVPGSIGSVHNTSITQHTNAGSFQRTGDIRQLKTNSSTSNQVTAENTALSWIMAQTELKPCLKLFPGDLIVLKPLGWWNGATW